MNDERKTDGNGSQTPSSSQAGGRQRLKVGKGEEGSGGKVRLRPVSLSNVPWGSSTPVDLYLHLGKELSLLFRKGQTLSPEAYAEVVDNTQKLYYDRDSRVNWQSLVDDNLSNILKTPLTTEAKAAVAYGSAARTTQKLLADFNEEGYETAQVTVDALNTLMKEPEALDSFFQLTIHDYYTYTHSVHVYIYASMLTRAVIGDENAPFLKELGVGFLLHDVGKKDIPPEVLNKKGKLDDKEWKLMKAHPAIGHDLLTKVSGGLSEEVSDIILQHHEKIDGSGYPKGLTNAMIGRFGKICAVADVYDALTTRRSYKEALSKMTAFTIMRDVKGHLDEKVLERFIRLAVAHLD